jgi:myosin heavy subunit
LKKLSSLDSPSLVLKETFDKKVADSRVDKKHKVSAFKWFCIKHFAGGVVYNVDGFVEKNKDQTNPEFLNMLKSSSNQVIQ